MKIVFHKGDMKIFTKTIQVHEIAQFESGTVHEVYATFSIAKDAEWSGRLFVLDMKEADEEGIGTKIHVDHKSPAFVGDEIVFTARFEEITNKGEIITTFEAHCGQRLIAIGVQGQRILKKVQIEAIFNALNPSL